MGGGFEENIQNDSASNEQTSFWVYKHYYWQSELLKLNRLDFHVIDVNFSKVSWQFPKKDLSKLYT